MDGRWTSVLELFFVAFPPAVLLGWAFNRLTAHDIRCDGVCRTGGARGRTQYSFAMFLASTRMLRSRIEVRVEPLLSTGRFVGPPRLLAGARSASTMTRLLTKSQGNSSPAFEVVAVGMRPLATWTIVLECNGLEGDLALSIKVGGRTYLEQVLARGHHKHSTRKGRGIWVLLATSALSTVFGGALTVMLGPDGTPLQWYDPLLLACMQVGSVTAFLLTRYRPLPLSIGGMGWENPGALSAQGEPGD
jgi:hypothetical protein